jgi:hypothetical protein
MSRRASTFAAVLGGLLAVHPVADHWLQSDLQAKTKGQPGWPGRRACAAHVATYTAATTATVALLDRALGLSVSRRGLVAGQLVSAATHYWADRRVTLERLANRWPFSALGKGDFYQLGQPRDLTAWVGDPDDETAFPMHLHQAGRHEPVGWDNVTTGTGAYHLDQAWHLLWLGVAALVTARWSR